MGTIASGRSSDARYSSDPQLARGLYHLLTRYGNERNRSATGAARININTTDRSDRNRLRDLLRQQFDQSTANAVLTRIGNRAIDRLFRFYKDSGLTADQFDQIADMITTNRSNTLRGRINVNTAPREVLLCLDGLTESDVDALISKRPASRASTSMSWVADALGAAKAENLGEQITVRSQQYSANIVAASGNGRAFKQVRIVVDARETVPRIIYRRDLTERGWPMDKQILASLRTGQSPETMTVASGSGGMGGVR